MQQELSDGLADELRVELRVEFARTGIKQYRVARRAGISESDLSGYLTGRKDITAEIAEQIRAALAELAAA